MRSVARQVRIVSCCGLAPVRGQQRGHGGIALLLPSCCHASLDTSESPGPRIALPCVTRPLGCVTSLRTPAPQAPCRPKIAPPEHRYVGMCRSADEVPGPPTRITESYHV